MPDSKGSVLRPEGFPDAQRPAVSIILPVWKGQDSPYYSGLLEQIKKQTHCDYEVLVAAGFSPNGHARNVAVREARGEFLVFIDETVELAHERVIENLLKGFQGDPKIGMTGAACLLAPDSTCVQRQYEFSRGFQVPVVQSPTESWRVQHVCMAIRKAVYLEVGGESDRLWTGTDNDLRNRVHRAGYSMVLVPDTWVYYRAPNHLGDIWKKSFFKGMGAAYAFRHYPRELELSRFIKIRNPVVGLVYKAVAFLLKCFIPKNWVNPLVLYCQLAIFLGFAGGWFRWLGSREDAERTDLPFKKKVA